MKPYAWVSLPENEIQILPFLDDGKTLVAGDGFYLYTHPVKEPDFTVEKDSQDWKGMDGATAFWLIERHSNHWGDAKLMMEEWLKANSHPVKELTDEEILNIAKEELVGWACDEDVLDFAKAILRKAQEK